MSKTHLLRGARQLLTLRGPSGPRRGAQMMDLGMVSDGAMIFRDGLITHVGPARRIENLEEARKAEEIEAHGAVVMPGFVDSHTHLIYGAPRLIDYEVRIAGRSYQEIADAGGGILSTVRTIRGANGKRLAEQARRAIFTMARHGTTTVEIKSGYGLDEASELKLLRVAAGLNGRPIGTVATFLGAHTTPPEFRSRSDDYIDFLGRSLIPLVARRKLASFADVYCDSGAFTVVQARRYLETARKAGLGLKIHASQFSNIGAVQLGIELDAVSVDHLEEARAAEIDALAGSHTIATLLPGSVFHLGGSRFAPARRLIDAGAAVALATDCNPGTSPTFSMPMILSLACAYMKMNPAEAITAATINGAHALSAAYAAGSLETGKPADFLILSVPDYRELPYYFGTSQVARTYKRGQLLAAETEVS